MDLPSLLKLTLERNSSDLHLIAGYVPSIRVNGELIQLKTLPILTKELISQMFMGILDDEQKENLVVNKELDFGYNFESTRFRINIYFTKGTMSASLRAIPNHIRTIDELHLPQILHQFVPLKQGLILVTGPTGEGKSSSLAAIINEVNLTFDRHILTIEDPIEYIYPPGRSIISQREVGHDTHSWPIALRAALREDPDVVLIGEMRDYETVQAALTIAETGHLVFSTVHTNSAAQTIDRIVDVFPSSQQNQIRMQLSSVLKAIISQRLVPTADNMKRMAVCEILLNNSAVSNIIRDGKTHLIDNVIQTSSHEGMVLLENSLYELYKAGFISRDTFVAYSLRPSEVSKLIDR